jgi:ATP-dependent protease HslVU (ClpYQ) peptidase subunit
MTTIAFSNGVMAGDGRLSTDDGAILTDTYIKVRDCGKYVVGLAGTASSFEKVFKWFTSGANLQKKPDGDWEALVWDKAAGTLAILEYGSDDYIFINKNEAHSIGSGAEMARIAMICGKSPVDALNLITAYNKDTGGTVVSLKCSKIAARSRKKKAAIK